jgi:hypothetical protein
MSLPETATERKSTYAVSETEVGRGVRRRRTTFSRSKGAKTPTAKADPGRVAAHAEEMRMKGIDYELPSHGRDMVGKGGFKGRYHAMHAEKQMIVSSPNQAVAVNRPMCTDCIRFFSKEAAFQGRKQVVSDPFVKREFFPDGSMIEHLRNGQVVQYNPENFAAAFPPGQR